MFDISRFERQENLSNVRSNPSSSLTLSDPMYLIYKETLGGGNIVAPPVFSAIGNLKDILETYINIIFILVPFFSFRTQKCPKIQLLKITKPLQKKTILLKIVVIFKIF